MNNYLIGEKLNHSYSKKIHNLFNDKDYFLMPLNENEFDEFMKNKNFLGLNVTIPYKEKVLKYIDEFDDAYIQRTTYGREGALSIFGGGTLFKYTDVFKITQQEMMDNMIYYLLKYTFNISNTIYDQLDVFNKSVKSDKKDDEAEVRHFVYENIFKDINYTEKENGGIFFATIDLNSICNLENATSGFISQKEINVEIEHNIVIENDKEVSKLSRLHIYGKPINAQLGKLNLGDVTIDLDVCCIYGEFNNNEYIEFMNFYNHDKSITKKGYYYYNVDTSQINSFKIKI